MNLPSASLVKLPVSELRRRMRVSDSVASITCWCLVAWTVGEFWVGQDSKDREFPNIGRVFQGVGQPKMY